MQGSVEERHKFIVDNLGKEFKAVLNSNVHYTAFEFREENQGTPSHYLLHLTKGAKGYELIKQVYDRYANTHRTLAGYVTYTFDPKKTPTSDFVDEFFKQENIETLKKQLMETFAKRSISAYLLFKEHQKIVYMPKDITDLLCDSWLMRRKFQYPMLMTRSIK